MAVALWLIAAYVLIVYFGTWALQIALWLLMAAFRLGGWAMLMVVGLVSLLALAIFDRKQLTRISRGEPLDAEGGALGVLKRWA